MADTARFKTQWFFDLGREYARRHGRRPIQPSFWNSDADAVELPASLLPALAAPTKRDVLHYHFAYDMDETAGTVASWLAADAANGPSIPTTSENVSLHANATQALSHLVLAAWEAGARRALLVTPIYFSVADACEVLGYEVEYAPTRLVEGCLVPAAELVARVQQGRPDLVVVTHPTYGAGTRWRGDELSAVARACADVGALLVVDASQSGLDWSPSAERSLRALRAPDWEHVALVQSPAKALFLNGIRFAHAVASPDLTENVVENVPIFSGSLVHSQASLAEVVYRQLLLEAEDKALAERPESFAAVRARNATALRTRFEEIRAFAWGDAWLAPTESGVLTTLARGDVPMSAAAERDAVHRLLDGWGVHAMPGSCMRLVDEGNPLCFRLNLSLPASELHAGVRALTALPRRP